MESNALICMKVGGREVPHHPETQSPNNLRL